MAGRHNENNQEESSMSLNENELSILSQIAKLLVSEKLMSVEEQLRFLDFLKEET